METTSGSKHFGSRAQREDAGLPNAAVYSAIGVMLLAFWATVASFIV
jgi:hypothetical protein